MSRKRKPGPGSGRTPARRLSGGLAALVVLAAVGGVWVWRGHPEYLSHLPWLRPASDGSGGKANHAARQSPRADSAAKKIGVRVYFVRATETQIMLVPFEREVDAGSPARGALQELISGSLPSGCYRPLPAGVRLLGLTVRNRLATADFSEELVTGFGGGSSSEEAAVYSIVNTLTSMPGIAKVQILVSGEQVETIGGHLDVRGPLAFDGELVAASR